MTEIFEPDLDAAPRILRLPGVRARTGLSRSSIYLRISQGCFPKSISLGERAVGWVESEVNEWLNRQIGARSFEPLSTALTREVFSGFGLKSVGCKMRPM